LFAGRSVEIIDIHKLREDMGEKTVAVDAFEGNNLVLVDEGHRGASGSELGHWMRMRNRLCERGFSFEYSATFGQAMKASSNKSLEQEYARCILVDYSYKYFYRDGYGKDYHILNLEDDTQEEVRQLYLTACLLAFYQQRRLYQDKQDEFRPYLLERPLWAASTLCAPSEGGGCPTCWIFCSIWLVSCKIETRAWDVSAGCCKEARVCWTRGDTKSSLTPSPT
jgi:hypothetical protein